jgi:hypothetical protein
LKEFLFNAYKVEKFPKYSNVSIYERFFWQQPNVKD